MKENCIREHWFTNCNIKESKLTIHCKMYWMTLPFQPKMFQWSHSHN